MTLVKPSVVERSRASGGGAQAGLGESWYADETYIKVQGRWCYLYRAIIGGSLLPKFRRAPK
jgi:transposase-like protein